MLRGVEEVRAIMSEYLNDWMICEWTYQPVNEGCREKSQFAASDCHDIYGLRRQTTKPLLVHRDMVVAFSPCDGISCKQLRCLSANNENGKTSTRLWKEGRMLTLI